MNGDEIDYDFSSETPNNMEERKKLKSASLLQDLIDYKHICKRGGDLSIQHFDISCKLTENNIS